MMYLSLRFTDRLTKDATKSAIRKWYKCNAFQLYGRVIKTSLWSSLIHYTSLLTVDIAYELYTLSKKKNFNITRCSKLIIKKFGNTLVCWFLSSVGFAVGALISPVYLSVVLSGVFEFGGSFIYSLGTDNLDTE